LAEVPHLSIWHSKKDARAALEHGEEAGPVQFYLRLLGEVGAQKQV